MLRWFYEDKSMIQAFKDKKPMIGQNVYIHPTAVIIGDVSLGDDCSIWPNVVIRGDVGSIVIGNGCNVQEGSVIHVNPQSKVEIGKHVTIGHMVHIHGASIHDNVLVGSGSIILDDVWIQSEVIIAAGSLVTPRTQVEPRVLMTGSPARVKRALTDKDLQHIYENASEYVTLKDEYLSNHNT